MKKTLFLLFTVLFCPLLLAEDLKEYTFEIDYVDSLAYKNLYSLNRSLPYSKEPAIEDEDKVLRGRLSDLDALWDIKAELLYLDINRDGDLTNDEQGIINACEINNRSNYSIQTFKKTIELNGRKYNLEFELNDGWKKSADFVVQSGYGAVLDFDGSKWYLAILDLPDGKLDLSDKIALKKVDHSFNASSGPPLIQSSEYVTVPFEIFVGLMNYEFSYSYIEGEGDKVRIVFKEKPVETGRLEYDVSNIDSLIFRHNSPSSPGRFVWIDLLSDSCVVPAGELTPVQFQLKNTKGKSFGPKQTVLPKFNVEAGQTAKLPFGTPLSHSVKIRKLGNMIGLDYKLVGVGGEEYNLSAATGGTETVSTVAVYKGQRKLSSGSFEYG